MERNSSNECQWIDSFERATGYLLHVVVFAADLLQRVQHLVPGRVEEQKRVLLADLPRDVLLVGALQLGYADAILDHLAVHVVDDVTQDFVLVLVVFDFADLALQEIVPQLVVVVVEQGPIQRLQIGKLGNLVAREGLKS